MKQSLFLFISLFVFCQCKKDRDKEQDATTTSVTIADVTFNNYIKINVLNKCTTCHGSSGGVSYDGSFSNLYSKRIKFNAVIQNGSMPQGNPLATADRALVSAWINRGAPEN